MTYVPCLVKQPKSQVEEGIKVMREIRKEHKNVLKRSRDQMKSGHKAEGVKSNDQEKEEDHDDDDADDEDRVIVAAQKPTDGDGKPKLSKAARKQLKKAKHGAGGDGASTSSALNDGQKEKSAARDFKDPQNFIEYGVTEHDVMVEDRLQPRSVEKGSEALLANRLEEALLDVQPDEALEMIKRKRIMHVSLSAGLTHSSLCAYMKNSH